MTKGEQARAGGGALPVTWLGIALAGLFFLLMLYGPFQFQAVPHRFVYPYLRVFGLAFGAAGLLLAAGAAAVGLPGWTGNAGRVLFSLTLLGFLVAAAVLPGVVTAQVTYGLLAAAMLLGALSPRREPAIFYGLYTCLALAQGIAMLGRPDLFPAVVYGTLSPWLGRLFLAAGLLQAAAHLLARRWPNASVLSTALAGVPCGWFALAWLRVDNLLGATTLGTLAVGALVWPLYRRRPWHLWPPGFTRRILPLAVGLAVLPVAGLGAVAVYYVQAHEQDHNLAMLQAAARQASNRVDNLLRERPGLARDPGALQQEVDALFPDPELDTLTLPLPALPEDLPRDLPAGARESFWPDGRRQLVAWARRPDLGLAILVTQEAAVAYSRAAAAARNLLWATLAIAAAAVAFSIPVTTRLTRRLAEISAVTAAVGHQRFGTRVPVHPGADDELVRLGETVNGMAAALEAYSEEMQAHEEELLAQNQALEKANAALQQAEFAADAAARQAAREAVRLRTAIECIPLGIQVWTGGALSLHNAAAARLAGLDQGALAARFRWPGGAPVQVHELPPYRALQGERVLNVEVVEELPGQEPRTLRWHAVPVPVPAGAPVECVAVMEDITEFRRLERARAEFLQVAAHELRNPVAGIKAMVALFRRRLETGRATGDPAEIAATVEREVDRVSTLLNEILEAFRVEAGRLAVRQEPLDLAEVAAAALVPYNLAAEGHRFSLEVPPGPIPVRGDSRRLEQVVRNLLSNAVKYARGGTEITVQIQVLGDHVRLTVRDQGIGIPTDELERVFGGFYRARNAGDRGGGGLGLGLYVCRDIVRQHGGRIWAESAEGRGTSVHVELPLDCHPGAA